MHEDVNRGNWTSSNLNAAILWECAVMLALALSTTGCIPEKGQTMTSFTESEFPDPALRRAAQLVSEGHVQEAARLAQSVPAGINAVGPEDDTLLIVALKSGNSSSVKALLALGADPNIPTNRSPIAVAASTARIDAIQALLSDGARPNGASSQQSALWLAANNNRKDVVDLLLANGADIEQQDSDQFTPALASARVNRFLMTEYLLNRGASPFAASSHGFTIGYWAQESILPAHVEEGKGRAAVIAKLRRAGFPWPPPSPKEVVAAKAAHRWPPHNLQ